MSKDATTGPLVSIVVISRDDARGLAATVESIRRQELRDYEVIVVSKGSSRGAAKADGLPAFVEIEQQASGISDAFNAGIARARGRWINFLNGGDRYATADVLRRVAAAMDGRGLIVAARAVDDSSGVRIPRDRSFATRDLELISHQASFFDAALFARHGDYSRAYRIRMDFEWLLRLPTDTPTIWLDAEIVAFEGTGISTVRPVRNSMEELRALAGHRRGALRIAKLLALYLPWRVVRHAWRSLAPKGDTVAALR